jgi:hypothetical protein
VRVRWYDEENITGDTVPVYLELKTRQGFASTKHRLGLTVPVSGIELPRLGRGIISGNLLTGTISSFGYSPDSPLRPVIKISYRRYRFTEMLTGTRVSLDFDIRSSMIAPELLRAGGEMHLEGAVIEVKGPSLELPVTLRKMKILDTDWSRYSKYSNCIDSHLSVPGMAEVFSPGGKIFEP